MFWKKHTPHYGNWRVIAVLAFAVTLVINELAATTVLLGGSTIAAVSDSYANLFAPSGVTFSIWSVIYVLLALYLLSTYGVLRARKHPVKPAHEVTILKLFALTSVLNTCWMLAWQYRVIWLSVLLMIGLLVSLKRIHNLLDHTQYDVPSFVTTRLPFSIYLGWISVATVANITVWMVSINWDGFGLRPGIWMVLVVLAAATIGIINALRSRDWAYLAVFVWAFAGILARHLSGSGFNGRYPSTIGALEIVLAVCIVIVIYLAARYPRGSDKSGKLLA